MSEALAAAPADRSVSAGDADRLLRSKGELAKLIRDFDWKNTSLGAQNAWPKSLSICAQSPYITAHHAHRRTTARPP
jgi:hypothetical protein